MPDVFHNSFLPYILIHVGEITFSMLILFALVSVGRKKTTAFNFCLIGIIFIIVAAMEYTSISKSILNIVEGILLSIDRFIFYASICLIYIFIAEIFPTNIRCAAFGLSSVVARLQKLVAQVGCYLEICPYLL